MKEYVLITGASSSVGRATAVLLSKQYPLILGGRNLERLKETCATCNKNEEHILWQYDLSNVADINSNLADLMQAHEVKINKFVHAAGISHLSPLRLTSSETMQNVMNVNFFSAVEILKMLTNKKVNGKSLSDVVFVSSISSRWGAKGMSLYSASKGALDSFARSMAHELAPSVRVNTVLPGGFQKMGGGGVRTPFVAENESALQGYLLGEGYAEDIAEVIEFLLSERARWITGQNFVLDGGKMSHC